MFVNRWPTRVFPSTPLPPRAATATPPPTTPKPPRRRRERTPHILSTKWIYLTYLFFCYFLLSIGKIKSFKKHNICSCIFRHQATPTYYFVRHSVSVCMPVRQIWQFAERLLLLGALNHFNCYLSTFLPYFISDNSFPHLDYYGSFIGEFDEIV